VPEKWGWFICGQTLVYEAIIENSYENVQVQISDQKQRALGQM